MEQRKKDLEELDKKFLKNFPNYKVEHHFQSCGRIEIIGNHTDHNNGKCIVASCDNMNMICATSRRSDDLFCVQSEGFPTIEININELKIKKAEYGTSAGLIRGVLHGIISKKYKVGGANVYIETTIPRGSGVSSSAAYSLLIGKIISFYYNDDRISYMSLARIAKFSENNYFKKKSGLLDQIACISRGFTYIDFESGSRPTLRNYTRNLVGYDIYIIDTKTSHSGLTTEYEKIPADMHYIANLFDQKVLRYCDKNAVFAASKLNKNPEDSIKYTRAIHFFNENDRVDDAFDALISGDTKRFIKNIKESGESSKYLLKNMTESTSPSKSEYEEIYDNLKLMIKDGAIRVHGGGFGGTLLAIINSNESEEFLAKISEKYPGIAAKKVNPSLDPLKLIL